MSDRCTNCGLEQHPPQSYDWLAAESRDADTSVAPVLENHPRLFKHRNSNMIFLTARRSGNFSRDSFHLHLMKEKMARTTGPRKSALRVRYFTSVRDHSRTGLGLIYCMWRCCAAHKLDGSSVPNSRTMTAAVLHAASLNIFTSF